MEYISILMIFSYLWYAYVMIKKQIPIISNCGVFFVFSIMYSLFPMLIYWGVEPEKWFRHYDLNEDELIVGTYLLLMSVCNIIFSYVFKKYMKNNIAYKRDIRSFEHGSEGVFFLYMCFSIISIYVGAKMSYTSLQTETEHSLISNMKTILAGMYVAYLVLWGMKKRTVVMFGMFVILMLVEQSRWYFFSVFIVTIIYLVREKVMKSKTVILVSILLIIIMSFVGLYRANVEINDYSLLLNPFFIEGDYGSYMVLQTYYLFYTESLKYCTFFGDYIIDPVIYIVPRFLFNCLGVDKDNSTLLAMFIEDHNDYLFEEYAPVGGFHYLAQASSALPFVGPLVITYIYARVCVFFENNSYKNLKWKMYFYAYTAGFAFVFIKTKFEQTVKYAMTLFLPVVVIYILIVYINKHLVGKYKNSNF